MNSPRLSLTSLCLAIWNRRRYYPRELSLRLMWPYRTVTLRWSPCFFAVDSNRHKGYETKQLNSPRVLLVILLYCFTDLPLRGKSYYCPWVQA